MSRPWLPRSVAVVVLATIAGVTLVGAVVVVAARSDSRADPTATPPTVKATTPTTTSAAPAAPTSTSAAPAPLSGSAGAALDRIWRDTPSGCLVVTDEGRILYEREADRPVVPASVTKTLTAIAAVDVLGADARLTTVVRAAAPLVDGVIKGDLWIIGGGDPVLGTDAWARQLSTSPPLYTSLDELATRVVNAGVRAVEGRVLADDSRYDAVRYVPSMPRRFLADGEIGPLTAASVNDGFEVWGHPGQPFDDPARGAAAIFGDLLRARGVTVREAPATGRSPAGYDIAIIESPTVLDLAAAMLRDSDNGTAELLVKEIGVRRSGRGTTADGVGALVAALGARGLPTAGSKILDGSGLSDSQHVTCRLLALAVAQRAPGLEGLPIAGRTGTLRNRLRGTVGEGRVRGKTGSLDGVSALSGVVDSLGGRRLSFAYVANDLAIGRSLREQQDALALALARE